jgi:hypothetical protein
MTLENKSTAFEHTIKTLNKQTSKNKVKHQESPRQDKARQTSAIMNSTATNTSTKTQLAIGEEQRFYMPSLGRFKRCCLLIGFFVGTFIYLSTLGAEFIAVMMWGKEILARTNCELVFFSLLWNLVTTCVALIMLMCLRQVIGCIFVDVVGRSKENAEDILAELLSYLEGRFAVGALVGICVSWNITNFVLGMNPQIIQSGIIMAVACLWCRVTLMLLGKGEDSLIYCSEENDVGQHGSYKSVHDEDDKTEPLLQTV